MFCTKSKLLPLSRNSNSCRHVFHGLHQNAPNIFLKITPTQAGSHLRKFVKFFFEGPNALIGRNMSGKFQIPLSVCEGLIDDDFFFADKYLMGMLIVQSPPPPHITPFNKGCSLDSQSSFLWPLPQINNLPQITTLTQINICNKIGIC